MEDAEHKISPVNDVKTVNLEEHTYCQVQGESKQSDSEIQHISDGVQTAEEGELLTENFENSSNTGNTSILKKKYQSAAMDDYTGKIVNAESNMRERHIFQNFGGVCSDGNDEGGCAGDLNLQNITVNWAPATHSFRRKSHKSYLATWSAQISCDGFAKCLIETCNFISLDLQTMQDHYKTCNGIPNYDFNSCGSCSCWLPTGNELIMHESKCKGKRRDISITLPQSNDLNQAETNQPEIKCGNQDSCVSPQSTGCRNLSAENGGEMSSEERQMKYCDECDIEFLSDTEFSQHLLCKKNWLEISPVAERKREAARPVTNASQENVIDGNSHIVQPGRPIFQGEYVRRRSFTKQHKIAWEAAMKKFKYVKCIFQNCHFLALSVEDMIYHYGYCNGDGNFAKFVCHFCGGRLTRKSLLEIHIQRSHANEQIDENNALSMESLNDDSRPPFMYDNRESSENDPTCFGEFDPDFPQEAPLEVEITEESTPFEWEDKTPFEESVNEEEVETSYDLQQNNRCNSETQTPKWRTNFGGSYDSTGGKNSKDKVEELHSLEEDNPEYCTNAKKNQHPLEICNDRDNRDDHIYSKVKIRTACVSESKDSFSVEKKKTLKHYPSKKHMNEEILRARGGGTLSGKEGDNGKEIKDESQSNKSVFVSDSSGKNVRKMFVPPLLAPQSILKREVLPYYTSIWTESLEANGFARCLVATCNFISLDILHVQNHFKNCNGVPEKGPNLCTFCESRLPSSVELRMHKARCKANGKVSSSSSGTSRSSDECKKDGVSKNRTGEGSNAGETENRRELNENETKTREESDSSKSNKNATGGEISPRKENTNSLRIGEIMKLKNKEMMDYNRIIQPGPILPQGHYLRRRSYSRTHKAAWETALEKHKYVKCLFQNCHFLAMSLEDMIYHFGYCIGDGSFAKFECPHCGGRLTSKVVLDIHIQRSHPDKWSNENDQSILTSDEEGTEVLLCTLNDWKKLMAKKELKTYGKNSPRLNIVVLRAEERVAAENPSEGRQGNSSSPDAPPLQRRKCQIRTGSAEEVGEISDVNKSISDSKNNTCDSSAENQTPTNIDDNTPSLLRTSRAPNSRDELRPGERHEEGIQQNGSDVTNTVPPTGKTKTDDLVVMPGKRGVRKDSSDNRGAPESTLNTRKKSNNSSEKGKPEKPKHGRKRAHGNPGTPENPKDQGKRSRGNPGTPEKPKEERKLSRGNPDTPEKPKEERKHSRGNPGSPDKPKDQGKRTHGNPGTPENPKDQGKRSHGNPGTPEKPKEERKHSRGNPGSPDKPKDQGKRSHGNPGTPEKPKDQGKRSHGNPGSPDKPKEEPKRSRGNPGTPKKPKEQKRTHGNPGTPEKPKDERKHSHGNPGSPEKPKDDQKSSHGNPGTPEKPKDDQKSSHGNTNTSSLVLEKNSNTKKQETEKERRCTQQNTKTENKNSNKNDQETKHDITLKRKRARSSKSLSQEDLSEEEHVKEVLDSSDAEGTTHEANDRDGSRKPRAKLAKIEPPKTESNAEETRNPTTRKRGRPPKRTSLRSKVPEVEAKEVAEMSEQPNTSGSAKRRKSDPEEQKQIPEKGNASNVKCANCDFEGERRLFTDHNRKVHAGLSWIEGENPIDLNDEDAVSWNVKQAFKYVKSATCGKCGSVKKSALGFISHMQSCGKSEAEKAALKVKCPHCPSRILKYSLPMHLKLSHFESEGSKPPLENTSDGELPSKRKSALRAVNKFCEVLKHEEDDEETKKKGQYVVYEKGVSKFPKLPGKTRSLWIKMMKEKKKIPCRRGSCLAESSSLQEARNHHFLCSELPQKCYVCERCDFFTESKAVMQQHVDIHPTVDGDYRLESEEEKSEEEVEMKDPEDDESESVPKSKTVVTPSEDSGLEASLKARFFVREGLLNERQVRFCRRSLRMTLESEMEEAKTANPIFPELVTQASDWIHVEPEDATDHFPGLDESISFRVNNTKAKSESDWKKMKRFQGEIVEDSAMIFTGGTILSMSWCKYSCLRSSKQNPTQYLAVSSSKKMEKFQNIHDERGDSPCLIQIYSCGEMKIFNEVAEVPEMAMGIVHDYGEVWDLAWFPLDAFEHSENGKFLTRIGLLGAACQDGTVKIWPVCDPDELRPKHSPPLYKVHPKVILELEDKTDVGCLRLAIGRTGTVVGGYAGGLVAVWNLKTTSSPFSKTNGKAAVLKPIASFQAHKTSITALSMCQNNDRYICTSGLDRFLKFWDLESPGNPFESLQKEVCLDNVWPKHWPLTISTFEDIIPSSGKGMIKAVREVYCDKHRTPLALEGTCWSLSFNEWLNILCGCNNVGEVKIRFLRNMFMADETFRYRTGHVVSQTELKFLNDSVYEKVQENVVVESCKGKSKKNPKKGKQVKKVEEKFAVPRTYDEAWRYFGLVFHDFIIEDDLKQKNSPQKTIKKGNQSLEDYPIASVTKVCWNPNYKRFMQLAVGHHCGLIRIKPLKDPKCDQDVLRFLTESEDEIGKSRME